MPPTELADGFGPGRRPYGTPASDEAADRFTPWERWVPGSARADSAAAPQDGMGIPPRGRGACNDQANVQTRQTGTNEYLIPEKVIHEAMGGQMGH
ncbi:hypothetical protein Misp01_17590 [Microtetraspora sp. NBRC 13810]|nr:hypothetical protein Misp01_17590 [Microtetraspora sp. NBRC 13810]